LKYLLRACSEFSEFSSKAAASLTRAPHGFRLQRLWFEKSGHAMAARRSPDGIDFFDPNAGVLYVQEDNVRKFERWYTDVYFKQAYARTTESSTYFYVPGQPVPRPEQMHTPEETEHLKDAMSRLAKAARST
jgi:hypothetical protein